MTQKYQVKVSMNQAAVVKTGLVLKQGDFGMQVEIEVLDFNVTGTTPQIVFRKSQGAVESTTITVASNKYTYTFVGTELDTPGKVICDLKLKNSTTQRISSASFQFEVVADTLDGLNERASSYSDTIEQMLDGYQDQVDGLKHTDDFFSWMFDMPTVKPKFNASPTGPTQGLYKYSSILFTAYPGFVFKNISDNTNIKVVLKYNLAEHELKDTFYVTEAKQMYVYVYSPDNTITPTDYIDVYLAKYDYRECRSRSLPNDASFLGLYSSRNPLTFEPNPNNIRRITQMIYMSEGSSIKMASGYIAQVYCIEPTEVVRRDIASGGTLTFDTSCYVTALLKKTDDSSMEGDISGAMTIISADQNEITEQFDEVNDEITEITSKTNNALGFYDWFRDVPAIKPAFDASPTGPTQGLYEYQSIQYTVIPGFVFKNISTNNNIKVALRYGGADHELKDIFYVSESITMRVIIFAPTNTITPTDYIDIYMAKYDYRECMTRSLPDDASFLGLYSARNPLTFRPQANRRITQMIHMTVGSSIKMTSGYLAQVYCVESGEVVRRDIDNGGTLTFDTDCYVTALMKNSTDTSMEGDMSGIMTLLFSNQYETEENVDRLLNKTDFYDWIKDIPKIKPAFDSPTEPTQGTYRYSSKIITARPGFVFKNISTNSNIKVLLRYGGVEHELKDIFYLTEAMQMHVVIYSSDNTITPTDYIDIYFARYDYRECMTRSLPDDASFLGAYSSRDPLIFQPNQNNARRLTQMIYMSEGGSIKMASDYIAQVYCIEPTEVVRRDIAAGDTLTFDTSCYVTALIKKTDDSSMEGDISGAMSIIAPEGKNIEDMFSELLNPYDINDELCWKQGVINVDTGQNADHANRIRTQGYHITNSAWVIEAPAGIRVNIYYYNASNNYSYIGYEPIRHRASIEANKCIRLCICPDASGTFTPDEYNVIKVYAVSKNVDFGIREDHIAYKGKKINLSENKAYIRKFCTLTKPSSIGTAPQGMDINNGKLIQLYDTGYFAIFDISSVKNNEIPTLTAEASGQLGSYAATNHANSCQFGNKYSNDDLYPLIYVTNGKVGAADAVCSVERYTEGQCVTIQTISIDYNDFELFPQPNFCVDSKKGFFYAFGAKLRTNQVLDYYKGDNQNNFVVIKFKLPDVSTASVTLTADDVLEVIEYPYNTTFMQSSTYAADYIISSFGVGSSSTTLPAELGFYSVTENDNTNIVSLMNSGFNGEAEGLAVYNEALYVISANDVYKIVF